MYYSLLNKAFSVISSDPLSIQKHIKWHSARGQPQIENFKSGTVATYFSFFNKNCLHYIKMHTAFEVGYRWCTKNEISL